MPTDAERLATIQNSITKINERKIAAQAEMAMLRQQYNEKVEALKNLGITDLSNLPQTLASLKQELSNQLTAAEQILTGIEVKISSISSAGQ